MLFTSYRFALFAVGAFAAYWIAGRLSRSRHPQNVVLLLVSYGFYALFDWRWCFLLAGVTGTGLLGGRLLSGWAGTRRPRRLVVLCCVLAVDLFALGFFKYLDFFGGIVSAVLGRSADQVTLHLVLPIGISYYIFQNLSYVFDVYRGDISGRAPLLDYGVALSFFPQLLSGPITRPRELLGQLGARRDFDERAARDGLRQILWGLIKKMVIADNIAVLVDAAWKNTHALDGAAVVLVALLYSFQIYCDFSGYADIAIGTAKLFNLRLTRNFDQPYLSTSVRQFWRRWHMTLASWMRDYVYISLGGSRKGALRRDLNTLVTFLLVGLWHGADLTFAVWGLLHGAFLVAENLIERVRGRTRAAAAAGVVAAGAWGKGRRAAAGLLVFALVTFAWVFFRAPSLSAAVAFLARLGAPLGGAAHLRYLPWVAIGTALLMFEALTPKWEHGFAFPRWWRPARWAVYVVACLVLLFFAKFGGQQGIYVQF